MQTLGIRALFKSGDRLPAIASGLYLTDLLSHARINVDYSGIEASAEVVRIMHKVSMSRPVVIDKPFIFIVYEQSAMVPLVMGRVTRL